MIIDYFFFGLHGLSLLTNHTKNGNEQEKWWEPICKGVSSLLKQNAGEKYSNVKMYLNHY